MTKECKVMLGTFVKSFGQWVVYKNGIYSEHGHYFIRKDLLNSPIAPGRTWAPHLLDKRWVDNYSFKCAFKYSLDYFKIKLNAHQLLELKDLRIK